ncbi:MAG: hypothetical protein WA196_07245, partial [Pseudolabrys sp.]
KAAYDQLLDGAKAEFVFTDPPYNVAIDGHVCGLGRIRHREFAMGCGEMSEADFTAFLKTVFALLVENTVDGLIHQICMDWRHMGEMLGAGCQVYTYSRRDSNLTFFAFASDLQEAIACLSTTCSAFDNFFSWAKAGIIVAPPRTLSRRCSRTTAWRNETRHETSPPPFITLAR